MPEELIVLMPEDSHEASKSFLLDKQMSHFRSRISRWERKSEMLLKDLMVPAFGIEFIDFDGKWIDVNKARQLADSNLTVETKKKRIKQIRKIENFYFRQMMKIREIYMDGSIYTNGNKDVITSIDDAFKMGGFLDAVGARLELPIHMINYPSFGASSPRLHLRVADLSPYYIANEQAARKIEEGVYNLMRGKGYDVIISECEAKRHEYAELVKPAHEYLANILRNRQQDHPDAWAVTVYYFD